MKSICIIPARSGSVRIKNKNIIKFQNKPIIYWSIEAAKKSKCFKEIIISTDSEKIAKIVKKFKNVSVIKRPKNIAKDKTPLIDVIQHTLKKINIKYDAVCCILPASPLIIYSDIVSSKKLLSNKCNFVIPITKYDYSHDKSIFFRKNNYINLTKNRTALKRSQELEDKYHDSGQFYWGKNDTFLKYKNIFKSQKVKGFIIPNYRTRDIDTKEDVIISNLIFKFLKK